MMTKRQVIFLVCYIIGHFVCSMFAAAIIDKEPQTVLGHITGSIGFALFFINLPFSHLIGGMNLILHSAVASLIYGFIIVFTYKAATDR